METGWDLKEWDWKIETWRGWYRVHQDIQNYVDVQSGSDSWGEDVSLILAGYYFIDSVTTKISYRLDVLLHRPASGWLKGNLNCYISWD